jgi:hypothetical protein
LGPRDRDVKTVSLEEKFEVARQRGAVGRRHRVEHNRRFLTLELVDGADADLCDSRLLEAFTNQFALRVVRGDDDEIARFDGTRRALADRHRSA